jgi:hypothetical protein
MSSASRLIYNILGCPVVNALCPFKLAGGIWWQVLYNALGLDLVTSTLHIW